MSDTFFVNRLIGGLPKVGLRPIVDGRCNGIREALERPIMEMAQSAAKLISAKLRHPCGAPVECVIADTCIGGPAEAAKAAEKFRLAGVGATASITKCWAYGTETAEMDPTMPHAIWGFNGTERPGAVYLAATCAGHVQKGLPAFSIYGRQVQDKTDTTIPADVEQKLLRFVRSGLAVATMRGKNYLSLGNVSMGIVGSLVAHDFLQHYLGMRTQTVDMVEFLRRIEKGIFDPDEFARAMPWVEANCKEGKDCNPPSVAPDAAANRAAWEFSVKMAMIGRDLMVGNPRLAELGYPEEALGFNAIAAGFQGQRQWTDYKPNGDFMEAILCSSFDWNGIRQPYMMATENDHLNGITMLLMHLLTGGAQVFADVRTYWDAAAVKRVTGYDLKEIEADGLIHLINSGAAALDGSGRQTIDGHPAMKPHWEITEAEMRACLDATRWHPALLEYFRGHGWSSEFETLGGMPITMARLNLVHGLGPVLQIAEGWSASLPEKVSTTLKERTDQTWPTTWMKVRLTGKGAFRDSYSVMANWGANHGAFSYGHIGADLIALAALLRIPVCMHNVPEELIWRPTTWSAFGTSDLEGADFRACASLGPLY